MNLQTVEKKIADIWQEYEKDVKTALENDSLNEVIIKYRSKKNSPIKELMKELPQLSVEDKRAIGPMINKLDRDIENDLVERESWAKVAYRATNAADLTYQMPPKPAGFLHPTTQVIREMNDFFRYHGFSIAEGPEIETDEYNFRKLNLPEGHPATDLQDTLFVVEPSILLRTHTSSVESRTLTDFKPPIRVVTPGKVYRNETPNATNGAFFHQYQGVVVDKGITIQHLKSTLDDFHRFLFKEYSDLEIRFRYKYYPEVSPGMGTDIKCVFCHGEGCHVCKFRGWIEVLGSGMIHYNTLKMCGIDPEVYTGFAFGMGLDRLVMAKFGIPDIRKLYGGEMIYI